MDPRKSAIARYLRTGDHDPLWSGWPGDVVARSREGESVLKAALVAAVEHRARGRALPANVPDVDFVAFTRRKVEPMVRGLFPRDAQDAVLGVLERSVVFLTPERIGNVLREAVWLGTAWDLANLYLRSLGAEVLSDEAPSLVGLSVDTTCYVSVEYFVEDDPFADFLVHETAHVFHNCKRRTAGLHETVRREWLLDVEFRKRETFAYCCEAYSRILELAARPGERRALVDQIASRRAPQGVEEYFEVLREAVSARNGWKRILARCAPGKPACPGMPERHPA